MTQPPFRFIHASDFHLERPPCGAGETPEPLRAAFVEAPYRAAQRVFDAALAEQVDFVVLAGDLLQPEATGPRGPLFLVEQFERLRAGGIQAYWAGGHADPPEHWPAFARLPDNVHVFPERRAEQIVHHREGQPLARLIGLSRRQAKKLRPGDFSSDADGLFSVAATYGAIDRGAIAKSGVRYWALGGRHARETHAETPGMAHYPGTTQGRELKEAGPHGCTLVDVNAEGKARTRLLPTDAVRWRREEIALDEATTKEGVERLLAERLRAVAAAAPGVDQLVSWVISGPAPLVAPLRRGNFSAETLAWLRTEFGGASPIVWSLSLEAESPETPSAWYQQDTILGDFLRAVRDHQAQPDDELNGLELETYLDERRLAGALAGAVRLDEPATRQRVLRKAAMLGGELLGGELSGGELSGGELSGVEEAGS
jgi:hypothetical protein